MIEHLAFMARTRPEGLDRDAAEWAVQEVSRLNALVQTLHVANATLATIIAQRVMGLEKVSE